MKPKRNVLIGVTFLVLLAGLVIGEKILENRATVARFSRIFSPITRPANNTRKVTAISAFRFGFMQLPPH